MLCKGTSLRMRLTVGLCSVLRCERLAVSCKVTHDVPLHKTCCHSNLLIQRINPLMPNDHYSGRTAPLNSKRCILYIYSTNIRTEYFKLGIHSPFFSLQNAVCFIILTYLVPVLFTFYIQGVLK